MSHATASEPLHVLVVDDEPTVAELMELVLDHHGIAVDAAQDGAEALRAVQQEAPDVIVLDVMMPGLDGLTVCRRLKSDPRYRDIPIIICSAAQRGAVDWREAGADAFLGKPFDVSTLPQLIRRVLPPQPSDPEGWH